LLKNLRSEKTQNDNAGRPTMCRSCGSIVGGGEAQCAVCGTSVSTSAGGNQTRTADGETVRFARAILNRPYKFTIVLLVANIFIFILMWQTSGIPLSMSAPLPFEVLTPFGAKVNYLIQTGHQWWRFVTPMFLHVNLLHLIVNMYSLWIVGPYVEKFYGSAKFVVFWVLTGVAGVIASYFTVRPALATGPIGAFIFKATDVPSAGASGALFGLVGVLFVFGIKFRHELPDGFKRAFGTGLLPMILLNLFIGYVLRGFIDNAAHLGGLVSGALLALVVDYRRPGERSGIAVTWRVLQWGAIAVVALSFLKTVQHFRDPLHPGLVAASPVHPPEPQNPAYLFYAKAVNDAQEALVVAMHDKNTSNIDTAVKNLDAAPTLDPKADELRQRLKALLLRTKETEATPAPSPPRGKDKPAPTTLVQDYVAWRQEYGQWLKTGARSHSGLEEIEPK
jgi:rhomboid protease GluP